MIIKNIHKLKDKAFQNQRILSLDFGTKKLGFAISDQARKVATPLSNHKRKTIEADIENIQTILLGYESNILVLGLPLDKDGSYGDSAQRVKSFANIIANNMPELNIFFWDERYSTRAASRVFEEYNISPKEQDKHDDKIAACIFLQSCLDFIAS